MLNLILALISGVIGAVVVAFIPPTEKHRLRNTAMFAALASALIFSWRTAILVFAGADLELACELGGLSWRLRPDPLGAMFALIASTLWFFAALYSAGYMAGKKEFEDLLLIFLAGQ